MSQLPGPTTGAEDFTCYLQQCPGAMFRVGTVTGAPNSRLSLHASKIIFDEAAIRSAAAVMVQFVLGNMEDQT